jgi:nicotinamide-nucleotide amidase
MLKAELLSIGDELLIGQIVNTNASYLSEKLNAIGVDVHRITTVGDKEKDILQAMRRAWVESDIVIATGGLGPTHDDISKNIVAKFFKKKLVMDMKTLRHVEARFKSFGYKKMPEKNIGQALVPEGFTALRNDRGTAPGLLFHKGGKTFIIMAGVPHEMKWLTEKWVLAYLKKQYKGKFGQVILHKTLLAIGIGESLLAEKIGDMKDILEEWATLAFLPKISGIRLRISVRASTEVKAKAIVSRVEKRILTKASSYIYGAGNDTPEDVVISLLIKRKRTLSVAESCTGGMLGMRITNVTGSSKVFTGGLVSYANDVKLNELGVAKTILLKYGAVSEQCAIAMAEGALKKFGTDYAISITGIAGPEGGTKDKPIGTVWIALAEKGKPTVAKLHHFGEGREIVRERSCDLALEMLRKRLLKIIQ